MFKLLWTRRKKISFGAWEGGNGRGRDRKKSQQDCHRIGLATRKGSRWRVPGVGWWELQEQVLNNGTFLASYRITMETNLNSVDLWGLAPWKMLWTLSMYTEVEIMVFHVSYASEAAEQYFCLQIRAHHHMLPSPPHQKKNTDRSWLAIWDLEMMRKVWNC